MPLGAARGTPDRALAARVIKVEDTHLILLLDFPSSEEADRVSREIGGPWMREHIVPLLARGTERSVGEVIASVEPERRQAPQAG